MKGTSKIIMGATLTMLISLAIVLTLVLLLLAELYCSLLLRRRKTTTSTATAAAQTTPQPQQDHSTAPTTLTTFHTQGVLHAPRNILFPTNNNNKTLDLEMQNPPQLPQKPHDIGLMFPSAPPSPITASPQLEGVREDCMYICNPIYDLEGNGGPGPGETGVLCNNLIWAVDTPFETPNSSPSRLGGGSLVEDDDDDDGGGGAQSSPSCSSGSSVALTPMKELPAKACSVSLKDASSLGTSRSDSVSKNDGASSSSSCSPYSTSSW